MKYDVCVGCFCVGGWVVCDVGCWFGVGFW